MTPETGDVIVWASGLSTLLAVGTTAWNLLTSGSRSNAKTLAEHVARIERLERHSDQFETVLANTPTQQSMHRLELGMADMRGDLAVLASRLEPIRAIAERLQEWSLAEKGGK